MPKSVGRNQITSSRRSIATVISDPDNGITFLDNDDLIRNPRNMKTPPPPMWGDVIEEDYYDETQPFYDHEQAVLERRIKRGIPDSQGKQLKKKVIYYYDDEEQKGGQKPPASKMSIISEKQYYNYNKKQS